MIPDSTQDSVSAGSSKSQGPPPNSQSQSLPMGSQPRRMQISMGDVLSDTNFAPFDHQGMIVEPFAREAARDAEFKREYTNMLLEAVLEFHAWAAARPTHLNDTEGHKFEVELGSIMERTRRQELTREQLKHSLAQVQRAFAVLTGMMTG